MKDIRQKEGPCLTHTLTYDYFSAQLACFYLWREIDSAMVFISRAEELGPDNLDVAYSLSTSMFYVKEHDLAEQYAKKAIRLAIGAGDTHILQ